MTEKDKAIQELRREHEELNKKCAELIRRNEEMTAFDATEQAYKNGYADAAAEFKVQLERLQANLKVTVETLEKIARGLPHACEYCAHRFADDPTFCLECDDEWHNGNFKWRGANG